MWSLLNDGLKGGYRVHDVPETERDMKPESIVSQETQR
ncbi:Uncharacterised protein [Mycobacterium tuberculosis]|nr:Uncharacterised protein [Mycobacterium tuberculosis]